MAERDYRSLLSYLHGHAFWVFTNREILYKSIGKRGVKLEKEKDPLYLRPRPGANSEKLKYKGRKFGEVVGLFTSLPGACQRKTPYP